MKSSSSNRTQLEQTASDCLQAWKYDIFYGSWSVCLSATTLNATYTYLIY